MLPAGLACGGFAGLDEQIFNELAGLHLVELLDADSEELVGQIIDLALVEIVLVDDALDEALLTVGAVPAVADSRGLMVAVGAVDPVGAAVAVGSVTVPIAGTVVAKARTGNKAGLLDFLIDGVLEKPVELLAFGLDLGEVGEFDFD